MAWKAGSAAALRAQKEKGRHQNQETTAASTPAKATQTSTAAGGWAKGSAAALREQKQTEATNIDLTSKAFDEYRANNNLGFADEMDSRRDWLNQQDMGTKDIYKDVNRWKDTDDNRNLSEAVKRIDGTHGAYTDADLIKNSNWTQADIDRARAINQQYETLPLAYRAGRRLGNSAKSLAASIAGAGAMAAGALPQAVGTEIKDDDRTRTLMRAIQRVDGTNGMYTDKDLVSAGWTEEEIKDARARLAAGKASSKVDNPVYNWGRDTHQKSEEWLADAQAGESGEERFLHNAAMSAGENLALGAVNPALVLPVLSLQGAGDSLAASDAKGESPEKAMAKAALKFGAGWAINSVGAADLAETMGSDYAKNTVAGQIAGWVRGMAGKSDFAQKYPAIANAVTGGIDNAMQAFVESYADQAIDAAMGDTEAAKQMLTQENFLSALESGLSGGVSGAMGGAAGTGVRVVKAKAEQKVQNAMEARAQAAQKAAAEKAKTPSVTSGDSSLGEGALEGQTAVNDDPAVHTAAQNASIEEYKNSVDPAMAKYVDDVRAGKKLEPFVVSKTGDRMRSAMMELTGLDKVGDYTMLDNNGVMHITNRHAGGDGSADATMKESADVARAAYVLNNFDNAYLAKDRADGYMTSNGKRAPIVLFEKKIDGSHIVVEAVCDTKKNKNFIVSEYLSKNGIDEKEIAKVLRSPVNAAADPEDNVRNVVADPSAMTAPPPQSPMDAVADFRDTSETLAEDHGAEASIAPETARVNEKGVENAGETVDKPLSHASRDSSPNEGSPWQDGGAVLGEQGPTMQKSDGSATEEREYADVDRKVDPAGLDAADEGSGQMRETYGLREPSGQTARQSEVQRQLEQWGVESGKTKAAQDISQKLPANVDADRYAAAASTIYHLAQMDEVKSFDDALRLAGVMDNTALNVNYILDSGEGGRIALNTAYLYGADAKEQAGGYGGGLTDQSTSGQGRVYYEGTLDHDGTDMGSQIIELNAAATGTDAVLKNVLQNNPNVRAYVDSETARIFFGDSVSDIFGTVLHEDYHWYNSLDQAGAKSLQDHALTYLAQMDGYESVDEMIRDKMDVYASQKLTYEQAAEELVADAWRGIFATEADFKRWVEFQRGQAEKNAGVRGSIHKVMNRVKNLLSDIISRAKEVLTIDPSNAAALKAKRLAEAQRRTLQNEYFAHAEKAMDTLRAAKENAAALKTESAAEQQGVRYSLPDMAKETEAEKTERQMALTIHPAKTNAERTAKVSETDWSGQRIQDVKKGLRKILNEFGIIDKTYTINDPKVEFEYRTKTVNVGANHQAELTKSELNDFALVQANIEEVLKEAKPLEAHRNRKKNDHVEGMIVLASALQDGERIIPVKAELKIYDDGPTVLYIALAETSAKDSSEAAQKRRAGSKAERNAANNAPLLPTGSSKLTIADFYDLVKDYPNFTKYFSNEVAYKAEQVEELKQESRDLEKQRRELNAERAAWMDSAEVKELETKKKSLGLFSAEAKAFKAGEEYQAYLANRKKFNHRGEELTARISEVDDALREANDRLEARKREIRNDQQINYNWLAEKAGGAAEYHRQLAKEKFGTTDAFEKAGYILPDGQMLNFAQYESTRDTDHREIMDVFGPTDVKEGTDALNKFLAEGNIRVMAEQPGIDLSASVEPTAQQLEQIREMAKTLGAEKRQFTLDFSTKDGGIAATKDYSGHIDADKIVREIREYYKTGELPAESSLARFRYQLNEQAKQADRDAKRNRQRQASRTIADNSAAIKTLTEIMGLTRGVRVSDDSILGVAERLVKASGAKGKADTERVAREMRTLIEYMKTEGADMNKAQGLAETIAGEILDEATYRNTELWQQYPEYHELSYTVDKNGKAKAELVRQYGSWGEAVAEARKHGVKLRQEEGHRDGNPAEEYEAIVNDTRSMGGTKQGAAELFRGAAKAAGVDGAASMESTEWLDVLMNVHDTIKPKMMSRFADVAEYEDAKVELAGRMIGDLLNVNEMNDAQAIFDSFQQWQRRAAAAAAGDETSAAKAVKDLRAVQKEQTREFNRRLAENQKAGNQSEAVQQMQEQQRRNAKAEAMLNANLDALGVDITNSGDMAEKLDVLKEAYEREWRAEKKRLKEERQQMLDEITLENKTLKAENRDLARQVANEQRRADRAEYSQIVQEREIMEWEAENQKKAEAWQQKQAQKNAIAVEVARQQRDEDIAVAKALAEKRVQRARDGRKADELKRSIRNNAAQLNQMILRPTKGKYVQKDFIHLAVEVAKMADMTILNDKAVARLEDLQGSIKDMMGTKEDPSSIGYDWDKTGVPDLIQTLRDELRKSKKNKLNLLKQQLTEAEALGDGEKAERLRDRLKARIRETENRTYLPMTVEQLRMLKAITAGTLHVIRTENKTLSLAKTEEVDVFAQKAGLEVLAAKGNETGRIRDALTKYNLDMLGAKRVFRMLGGYTKNGQMEKLADMLNQGQLRQTQITVEGTKLFDNVTGKANLKQMERFAGPGAELVDIGLTDAKGKAVPLTHGQLCSLYMHLQNTDSREHLLNGGLTLPDTTLYNEGDIERAYQKGQTVKIGMLTGADGMPMADTILNTVENALTDYDRKWIEDMKGFFGDYTTNLINETSMKLVGFQRATVKNYYPIAVDKTQLASEIEGLKLDATIEGRGMLKERVKSGLPILLEECSSVVQRSLRDTAAYAGLAAPIRDANRILNANVETEDGIQKLKSGVLKEHWGRDAVNYVDYLLTDLQTKQRKRSDGIGRVMGKLRGNYAGAILTLNPGVAIAQAASLPTAGAVLGSDTMAAVLPFVKNLSGKQRRALEAEISAHGDALLQYRLRGSQRGELASIGVSGSFAEKAMDKLPKSVTGWINSMDEITVAALWEASKHYVEHHAAEFADGAATKGSDAYWKAVNQMYQKVIEETQPNYTVMQRAGIQRSDNEITKTLTMFTTQRFQNYGILADAVMDYKAQRARYKAEKSAENKAEVQRAGQSLRRAAASQVIQTAVFALMKIGADFLLHRWDREQDENGDVTAESLWNRFAGLFTESAAGNFLFGSEIYSMVGNAVNGTDYDVVSATNISAVNDLFAAATKLYTLIRKDTTGMDEEELEAYHRKLRKAGVDVMEYGLDIAGIPAANGRKMVEAFAAYADDVQGLANGEGFSLNGTPASATGQYDRLFNAIERGDTEEAAAALGKLDQMGKSDKVKAELKKRLKNYDPDILEAAKARNAGDDRKRQKLTKKVIRELYDGLGISATAKSDRVKREAIIDLVTGDKHGGSSYGAINELADELLAGDKDRNVYDDLTDALEVGRAKDVQTEIDRLLTAGKDKDAIKSNITGVVKSEYLAGNDHDREKLAEMLLRLEAGGEPLYEEKNFESWIKQDEKKQEAAAGAVDEWAEVR